MRLSPPAPKVEREASKHGVQAPPEPEREEGTGPPYGVQKERSLADTLRLGLLEARGRFLPTQGPGRAEGKGDRQGEGPKGSLTELIDNCARHKPHAGLDEEPTRPHQPTCSGRPSVLRGGSWSPQAAFRRAGAVPWPRLRSRDTRPQWGGAGWGGGGTQVAEGPRAGHPSALSLFPWC